MSHWVITRFLIIITFSYLLALQVSAVYDKVSSAVKGKLENEGFWVAEGKLGFYDCEKLKEVIGNCYGANDATPYGVFAVPAAPGEFKDPRYKQLTIGVGGDALNWGFFRMRPDEAIVMIGMTPPEHRYFGFTSNLFTKQIPLNIKKGNFMGDPDDFGGVSSLFNQSLDPTRREIFGSTGLTLNHVNIKTTGIRDPFNALTVIVYTPSRATFKYLSPIIEAELKKNGIRQPIINVIEVPSNLAKLGYSKLADDFMMLFRSTYPKNQSAASAYRAKPPVKILRIVPNHSDFANNLFTLESIPSKESGWSEDYLKAAQQALADAVVKKLSNEARKTEYIQEGIKWSMFEGQKCIPGEYLCAGDNHDTTYDKSPDFTLANSANEIFVSVAINHTNVKNPKTGQVGKATYTNYNLMHKDTFSALISKVDSELTSTLDPYLSYIPEGAVKDFIVLNKNAFYVQAFSRQCSGVDNCVGVSSNLPVESSFNIYNRAYLAPGTDMAPAYSEILTPLYIKFIAI